MQHRFSRMIFAEPTGALEKSAQRVALGGTIAPFVLGVMVILQSQVDVIVDIESLPKTHEGRGVVSVEAGDDGPGDFVECLLRIAVDAELTDIFAYVRSLPAAKSPGDIPLLLLLK
jgi:hypothetical protein